MTKAEDKKAEAAEAKAEAKAEAAAEAAEAKAEKESAKQDETIAGGRYELADGRVVDSEGKELKK